MYSDILMSLLTKYPFRLFRQKTRQGIFIQIIQIDYILIKPPLTSLLTKQPEGECFSFRFQCWF